MAATNLFEILSHGTLTARKSGQQWDLSETAVPDAAVRVDRSTRKTDPIVQLLMENRRIALPSEAEAAWSAITDIRQVAACFPQATVESYDGQSVTGTARVDFGLISRTYSGTASVLERNDIEHKVVLEVKARDVDGQGTVTFRVTGTLVPSIPSVTQLVLAGHIVVTGLPAQLEHNLLGNVLHLVVNTFLSSLGAKLTNAAPCWEQSTTFAPTGMQATRVATRAEQRKLEDVFDVTASLFHIETDATLNLQTKGMEIVRQVDDTLGRLRLKGQLNEEIEREFLQLGQLALTVLRDISSEVRSKFGSFVSTYYPTIRRRKTLRELLGNSRPSEKVQTGNRQQGRRQRGS